MIKREFKANLKSFIIWLSVLVVVYLFVYLIYPYFITGDGSQSIDELMQAFPPELLKAFNMDMGSISTAYGWLKSEGFMFILLIVGFYASYMGGTILLKEESEKTIEYLGCLPIKRSRIITNKIIVALTYITALIVGLGLFNYIALTISGDLDQKQFILLSITPLFIAYPLFAINLFISTFMHKTKKVVGISLGMVFFFYLFSVLSEISDKAEFMKYLSIYTLADVRNVISDVTINWIMVVISIATTLVFSLVSYLRYNKKELV